MCELVMRRALSIELEEHLVNQVLKVEDGGFLYTIEQFFRARDALGGIEVAHPFQLEIAVASFPSTWKQ